MVLWQPGCIKGKGGRWTLLSNLKMFKRQVLILTATVLKMSVFRREKRRTLELSLIHISEPTRPKR